MNLYEMFEQETKQPTLIDALRDFLPIAVEHLQLKSLPKIKLKKSVEGKHLPTFGSFNNDDSGIELNIANRHPNDILRTLAHEMVHHKQNELNELDADSWQTGSDAENEANAEAGVIMRLFNKAHPKYLKLKPIMFESAVSGHDEPEDMPGMQSTPSDPIPFPKGTTLVNVSDVYDWYKLGMAVSDLDDADPRTFNKGVPHTVFAFGSEEEEHKMIPLLKRLGFSLHDIDSPKDYEKAIRADEAIAFLESYTTEAKDRCPPATQDITLNLKNRQKAIDEYGYGPLNPLEPNRKFWMKKVDMWNLDSPEEAKKSLCGNCAAFDISEKTIDCIERGIGTDQGSENPHDVVEAGDLGYCRFLKFKCASLRTCDAWVVGGPITEQTEQVNENLRDWFGKEKWVRMDTKGNIKGPCARGSESEGKPKCLPQAKAHALGKKGRAAAAQKKRREDPNPERRGKAINVATKVREEQLDEKCWKGYHKEGNKKMFGKTVPNCVKNESLEYYVTEGICPECQGLMVAESQLNEKQDACYHKVKSRYKVWPSAYASGALVQCRKKGAANWGNKSKVKEAVANTKFDANQALDQIANSIDLVLQQQRTTPRLDVTEVLKLIKDAIYELGQKTETSPGKYFALLHQQVKRVAKAEPTAGSGNIGTAGMEARHALAGIRRDTIPTIQQLLNQSVKENFADGKKPGRKGLAKRSGVDCGKSVTDLRKIAKNSSGEKQRMAHWCANMKSGRKG